MRYIKKIISLILVLCLIGSLVPVVAIEANAQSTITNPSNTSGDRYSAKYADKLDDIFAGNVQLFSNTSASFALGQSLNNNTQYTVANAISGWQCYIYAQAVYYNLFGDIPYHGSGYGSFWKESRTVLTNQTSASYEMFQNAGVGFGAYVRTTANSDGSYNGNSGHSFIILKYDSSGITYLEGNADGRGLVRITTQSWSEFNNDELGGKSRRLCHIVQCDSANEGDAYVDSCTYYPSYVEIFTPSAAKLWNMPCSDKTSSDAKHMDTTSAGETLTATALYLNTAGNYWYRVTYNGNTRYLYGGNAEVVQAKYDDLKMSNIVAPSRIEVGKSFPIGGTITTQYTEIVRICAKVFNNHNDDLVLHAEANVNTRNYSLKGSEVDKELTFGSLAAGEYHYQLAADVVNYYTTDGTDLEYVILCGGEYATDFTVGTTEHTHVKGSYLWEWRAHPHYSCYSCAICGEEFAMMDEPNYNSSCAECRPGKPVLNVYTGENREVTFSWSATSNTTHYNVWVSRKNEEGNWETAARFNYAKSGFTTILVEGEYRAQLQAYDSNHWEADGSDWVHTLSDDVYFTIADHRPGKPVLNVSTDENGIATFTWDETANTTYYEMWIGKLNEGSWQINKYFYSVESGFSYSFEAGEYCAKLYAFNSYYTEEDGSNRFGTVADDVYFTIESRSQTTPIELFEYTYAQVENGGDTVYYEFAPWIGGEYTIHSITDLDTVVTLYDSDFTPLISDDDSGPDLNFSLTCDLEEGQTYYYGVRYYSTSQTGEIPVVLYAEGDIFTIGLDTEYSVSLNPNYALSYYFFETSDEGYMPYYAVLDINENAEAVLMDQNHAIIRYMYDQIGDKQYSVPMDLEDNTRYYLAVAHALGETTSATFQVSTVEQMPEFWPYAKTIEYGGDMAFYWVCPQISGTYTMQSISDQDVYVTLYDSNLNQLASDDDSGPDLNFQLSYEMEAYEMYYIGVRYYNSSKTGDIPVVFHMEGTTYVSGELPTEGHIPLEPGSYTYLQFTTPESGVNDYSARFAFDGFDDANDADVAMMLLDKDYVAVGAFVQDEEDPGSLVFDSDPMELEPGMVYYVIFYNYGNSEKQTYYTISPGEPDNRCGDNLTWSLSDDGVLTISGTGPMWDYYLDQEPGWTSYWNQITMIIIEPGVTSIGQCGFEYLSRVVFVQIPDTITEIGGSAFIYCDQLTNITIPESVAVIGDYAFANCECLTEITFTGDAPEFVGNPFAWITASVYYPVSNATWTSDVMQDYGGSIVWVAYGNATEIASGTCGENLTWTLSDDGVLTISGEGEMGTIFEQESPWYAYNSQIQHVVLEEGITTIGVKAFMDCCMTGIVIPESVVSIEYGAFYSCSQLKRVDIPAAVIGIGGDVFRNCDSLAEIRVDEENQVFSNDSKGVLFNKDQTVLVLAPPAISGHYTIPDTVTEIDIGAFYACQYLTGVSIPDSVTDIGWEAFGECSSLTEIVIPEGVDWIGSYTFYRCYALEDVTLPNTITAIAFEAFEYCVSLKSIAIPKLVANIDEKAFKGCYALEQVEFLGSAPEIAENAFTDVTAIAYYPVNNPTWIEDVMRSYGGDITWVPYEASIISSGTCGDNLTWSLSDDGVLTISGTGPMWDYSDDSPAPWYSSCSAVTSVIIEDGVTSIGDYAFSGCVNMTSVEIPNSVGIIDFYAFGYCSSLTSIVIPESVYYINSAFAYCHSLTEICVDEDNETYLSDDRGVLFDKEKTHLIYAPGAISGHYTIPNSVTEIGHDAFYECWNLTGITIPDGVNIINQNAFVLCTGLTSIEIPASVSLICDGVFYGCTNLTDVTFRGDAPVFEDSAFGAAEFNAHYPSNNPTWTEDVMQNYSGEITWVPYSVATEVASGWSGATQWTLTDDGVLTVYGSGNMKNYDYGGGQPWLDKGVDITSVVIEEGVTSVGSGAFRNLTTLETVTLPESLTRMGEAAFYGSGLESVEIPAALWTIQPYTFKNCANLTSVTFHEGNLQKISDGAFYGTGLTEVVLPDCLDILDVYAFKGCSDLASITIGSGLTELREAVFYGTAISEITIPEGITKVGPYAFKLCVNLEHVELPESLTSIGEASFYDCAALASIELPDAVTSIGNYAFRRCIGLTEVTFGEGLVTIGESSFYGCTGITSLTIPDSVTTIKGYAFKSCTGLTDLTLGSSVKNIGESAFHTCTGLKKLVFPASMEVIGEYCFSGSWNLWHLTFEGDAPTIGAGAFNNIEATAYYPSGNLSWTSDVMQNYGGNITWKALS